MTAMHGCGSTRNSRWIKAAPAALYQALTDPEALATWRAPGEMTGVVHHFDLREGGGYEMSLYYPESEESMRGKSASREDRYTSRFVELTPPSQSSEGRISDGKIVEAITFDSPDPAFSGELIMEVTLAAEAGGTLVTIAFQKLPPGVRPEDNEAGTESALEKLDRYVNSARPLA
jgi:uncharacterized protein YndB with AHSA1/START domain